MKRILTGASLSILTACAMFAQGNPPAFEVATIKQAAPQTEGRFMVRMGGDPGRVDYANVALKAVLARAYNVKQFQISGPSWLDSDRYDITAKVPEGVSADQVPAMLQALLAERFKMTTHKETKEQAVYALVVGKGGPKLTKSDPTGGEGAAPRTFNVGGGAGGGEARQIQAPKGAMMMTMSDGPSGGGRIQANGATMARFADMLSNMLDRPVVDKTGIEGNYDIALDVSMEDMAGMRKVAMMHGGPGGPGGPGGEAKQDSGPSIFTSVQTLGLKLESRKEPLEFVIVDNANKVPTEN